MKRRLSSSLASAILAAAVLLTPGLVRAQQSDAQEDNGIFVLGSVILSILHVPAKLVTCVATQAEGAVWYAATFGVAGGYEGGTNGKDIGETARRSCKGDWIITPRQVKNDYGE